jgi:hypothetical protein
MSFVLVEYSDNYADEFDVAGIGIFKPKDWDERVRAIREQFEKYSNAFVNIGSNEDIEYSSFEEWNDHFTVIHLEDAEAKASIKALGKSSLTSGDDEHIVLGFFNDATEELYFPDSEDDWGEDD